MEVDPNGKWCVSITSGIRDRYGESGKTIKFVLIVARWERMGVSRLLWLRRKNCDAVSVCRSRSQKLQGGRVDHIQFTLHLLAAAGLGGLIGLERQLTGHASGMRTCALVCVGASLFTAFSFCLPLEASRMDVSRVAAQIVSGVGFLGSGIIFKDGSNVRGINTAATIWCTAAVGIFTGAGLYIPASIAAAGIFLGNVLFRTLNRAKLWGRFDDSGRLFKLTLFCDMGQSAAVKETLHKSLSGNNFYMLQIKTQKMEPDGIRIEVKYVYDGKNFALYNEMITETVLKMQGVRSAGWAYVDS